MITRNCYNMMRKFADEYGPHMGMTTEAHGGGWDTPENPETPVSEVDKQEAVIAPYDTGYNKGYESGIREGAQTMYNSLLPGLDGWRDRYRNWRKYGLRGGGALLGASIGGLRGGALGTLFGGAAGWFGGALMDRMLPQYNPFLTKKAPIAFGGTTAQKKQQEAV